MPKYSVLIILLFELLSSITFCQINVDSLEKVINSNIVDGKLEKDVVQDLKYLIAQFRYSDWEKAYHYADLMENSKTKNNKVNRWAKGLGLKYKGNLHCDKGEYQAALAEYYEALEFYISNNDSLNVADMYTYIAYLYFNLTDFVTAEQLYKNALEINKTFKNRYYIDGYSNNLMMLASIAVKQNQFRLAKEFSIKAKKTFSSLNDTLGMGRADIWIVKSLVGLNELDSAETAANIALQRLNEVTVPKSIDMANEYKVYLFNELGKTYQLKGDNKNSLINYKEANSLADKISNSGLEASVEISLSNIEFMLGNADRAISLLEQIINNKEYENLYQEKINAAALLSKIYQQKQNYKIAYQYKLFADTIKDSLLSSQVYSNLNNLRAVYEYDRRKKENELLETNFENEKKQKYYVITFFIILSILSILLVLKFVKTKKLNQKLHVYNEDKKTLIKILAHDLKNPFSNFISSIDLINYQYDSLDEKFRKEILNNLNTSAHKYHSLLENILSWIRTDSENEMIANQKIVLRELVEEIVQVYKPTINDKNIGLDINIKDDYFLYSDWNILSAIIRNIINNSVKFTRKNGTIKISADDKEEKCVITIADNGIGMNSAELQKLFSGKISASQAEEKGYGFGMQIISEMIKKINAEIDVTSEEGIGTSVKISLN